MSRPAVFQHRNAPQTAIKLFIEPGRPVPALFPSHHVRTRHRRRAAGWPHPALPVQHAEPPTIPRPVARTPTIETTIPPTRPRCRGIPRHERDRPTVRRTERLEKEDERTPGRPGTAAKGTRQVERPTEKERAAATRIGRPTNTMKTVIRTLRKHAHKQNRAAIFRLTARPY